MMRKYFTSKSLIRFNRL